MIVTRRNRSFFASGFLLALLGAAAWANHQDLPALPTGTRADSLVVWKAARRLDLFVGDSVLKSYPVALGRGGPSDKVREGDRRVPEGSYLIDRRLRESAFHRALHVSYPDSSDVAAAASRGVPPGHGIMVHGIRNGLGWLGRLQRLTDWTAGCVAVTNWEIEELWTAVRDGTPITINGSAVSAPPPAA